MHYTLFGLLATGRWTGWKETSEPEGFYIVDCQHLLFNHSMFLLTICVIHRVNN
jgi:hypothetical protein